MSLQNIWRVTWHYEVPNLHATGGLTLDMPATILQTNSVTGPQSQNAIAADGPSAIAVIKANFNGPPGSSFVCDSVVPASTPSAYQ